MSTPSKVMSPGELAVGQLITVYEWEPIVHEPDPFSAAFGVTTTISRDNSWKGDILEVTAVMLPYIVVRERNRLDRPIEMDTRRVKLMEVTAEYAAAMGITKPCQP